MTTDQKKNLLASNGNYKLFEVKDYPLCYQVWDKDSYVAGFTDRARADIYLRARG